MKILILDLCYEKESLHKQEFVKPISDILISINATYDTKHFTEDFDVHYYEKVILCGVALKDFEYMNHLDKFKWIKEFRGDILGVCAGAQIIAKIFGASLQDGEKIGFVNIQLIEEAPIFTDVDFKEVYCLHSSSINIKKPLIELARTKNYTQVFRLDEQSRNIYGVLFHPEVRNKNLIKNFINI